MKRIVVDFRMHKSGGIGRYIRNLLPYLINKFDIVLLGDKLQMKSYNWKCDIINLNSQIYSLKEQLELFLKIPNSDVFWSPHYNVPILPIKARKRIVTIHDVFHLAFYNSLDIRKKIYIKLVMKQAIEKSDEIITVSNFSRQEIYKYTNTKKDIKIVYNGIDINKFKIINDKFKLYEIKNKYNLPENFILFVGNVKPHKNLKNLLLALKNMNINLVIAGKRDGFITPDNEIFNIIRKYTLGKKVFFTGYIEDDELPLIYNLAKIFVFPSFYEGFGIPPLEAMACGCPCIVSNAASLPEVCGDAAYYINPYDVDDIARGIYRVLTDENLRQELIKKGFDNIKRFSWEKSAQKVIEIIEGL